MSQLLEKVREFIKAHNLFLPGHKVLVAWSGGADSTALVEILRALSQAMNVDLLIVHVDHGQTAGSHQVLQRLRARARRLRLMFLGVTLCNTDLPPGSSEERCRQQRYRVLQSLAREHGCDRIATGHTQDDQVETVLMRMVRGTRIDGLMGIPAKREELFIRPLLCCSRGELRSFLRSRRIRWVEDPSNQNPRFLRNQIRHSLLPTLRTMNPEVDRALLRLSAAARRDCQVLNRMAAKVTFDHDPSGGVVIPLARAQRLPDAVLLRVLLRMVRQLMGPGSNLPGDHLERLIERIRARNSDKRWSLDLPGGMDAGREGSLFFLRLGPSGGHRASFRIEVRGPGIVTLPDRQRMRFKMIKSFKTERAGTTRVFFDGEEVHFPFEVRSLLPGDRMRLWGTQGSHKVNRLLMEAKLPMNVRLLVPLLAKGKQVLWVAGIRRSSIAPVKPHSQKILAVELLKPAAACGDDRDFPRQ